MATYSKKKNFSWSSTHIHTHVGMKQMFQEITQSSHVCCTLIFFSFLFYFSLFCCLSFKKFLLQLTDKSVSQPNNDSWFRWKNTVPNTSPGAISLFWLKEGHALEFIEGFWTRHCPVLELNSFSRKGCRDSDRLSSLCTESAKVGSFTPWKLPEVLNQVCFLFFFSWEPALTHLPAHHWF